ncbi:MAG: glycosyltransferase family 4 protein [Desulfobulbaceae bacterium]
MQPGYDVVAPGWIVFAFTVALVLTGLVRQFAIRYRKLDIPGERSSHAVPTPRGGGLAVIVAVYTAGIGMTATAGLPLSFLLLVGLPGLLVAGVGLADDLHSIGPLPRLLVHFAGAFLFLFLLEIFFAPPWLSGDSSGIALRFILASGLVWAVNLNNFMDGIDGIASVEALCVLVSAAVLLHLKGGDHATVAFLLAVSGAVLGFLAWNWPPARIFMGDACSGFLGLLLGMSALVTWSSGTLSIWSWLILYAVFLVDATWTLLRRILRGERFYEPHRSHAYQILSRRLRSHGKVTLGVAAINICWLFPLALVSSMHPRLAPWCFGAACFPLLLGVLLARAGTTNE